MTFQKVKICEKWVLEKIPHNTHISIDIFNFKHYKTKYGKQIKIEDNTTCTICLDDITKDYFCYKKCKHMYHAKCLKTWLTIERSCPNCRKEYP